MDSNSTCPSGGEHKPTIDDEVGEKICQKCGKVLGKLEPTDLGYKNRPEVKDGKEYDMGSFIGQTKNDRKKVLGNLNYMEKHDANLEFGKKNITKYAEAVTPQKIIIERATELFKKVRRKSKRNIDTLAVACVLYACRQYTVPIEPTRLEKITGVKETRFTSIYREIYKMEGVTLPLDKAVNKLQLVASKVKLPESILRKAKKVLAGIPSSETGSSPMGIAAAMLYLVSSESEHNVTQKQLAEAAGMNIQTIRKSVKRLRRILKK